MKKKVPLYIVSGFLGSGKTTFLKNILEVLGAKTSISVIQSEFPISSFDSGFKELTSVPFTLLELNRGSSNPVQLSKDHAGKIAAFLESSNPGIIFLEASGLAKLREILAILSTPPLDSVLYLAATIIIIDASRFEHEVTFLKNIRQQVKAADIVLVNKYEKLNRLESPEVIVKSYNYNKIIGWIKEINPDCKIYPSLYSRIPLEVIDSFLKSV